MFNENSPYLSWSSIETSIYENIVHHQNYRSSSNFSLSIDFIVYRQNYSLSSKWSSSSKYYRVSSKSLFIMETIVTSQSTWIVEAISKIWEAMKINVKHWQILWGGSVLATTMECLLISLLNNLRNIIFFYLVFWNIVISCFFSYRYL